jgi:hypothetical protein
MSGPSSPSPLRGIYRLTLGLAAIGFLALLQTGRWDWLSSYAAGVGVSLGSLRLWEWVVPRFLREQRPGEMLLTVGALLGKYVVIGALFYGLARQGWLHILAFLSGFLLMQGVLAVRFWAWGRRERGLWARNLPPTPER